MTSNRSCIYSSSCQGRLPWQNSGLDDDHEPFRASYQAAKMITRPDVLFAFIPDSSFKEFFSEVKNLAWGEMPHYENLIDIFARAWKRRGYGRVVDWMEVWQDSQYRQ